MKPKNALVLWTLIGLLLCGSLAAEEKKQMLLLLPGFPGSSGQAQPFVDKILRYLEVRLEWPANSIEGVYISDGEKGVAAFDNKAPQIALMGPSVYAARQGKKKMKIIARVEVQGRGEETYSVVVRKGTVSKLSELKGKTAAGAVVHDAKYVMRVLFGGALPEGSLKLMSQKRPLKSLRDLAKGKIDAAIVDQAVIEHMKELPFGGELEVIFTSKPVPAPAVVAIGATDKEMKILRAVLVGMCAREDGKELCKTLTISSIKGAEDSYYAKIRRLYGN